MRAHLRLELTSITGETIAVREAHNAVLQSGAELLGRLFAGQGIGITHMFVGTSDAPEGEAFNTATLQDSVEVRLAPEAFTIDQPDPVRRVVRVRVRATIPAPQVIGNICEAALGSRGEETAALYNRVTFSPLEKLADHELTLFWEVGFPYGDLQWLL